MRELVDHVEALLWAAAGLAVLVARHWLGSQPVITFTVGRPAGSTSR